MRILPSFSFDSVEVSSALTSTEFSFSAIAHRQRKGGALQSAHAHKVKLGWSSFADLYIS